jgi:hypothetical protein
VQLAELRDAPVQERPQRATRQTAHVRLEAQEIASGQTTTRDVPLDVGESAEHVTAGSLAFREPTRELRDLSEHGRHR